MIDKKLTAEFRTLKNRSRSKYNELIHLNHCPFCGAEMKTFLDNKGYERCTHHLFGRHPKELLEILRNADENYEEQIQVCPVCFWRGMNIASHVCKNHNMLWNDFVQQYNWQGAGHICLEKTKQLLSSQKVSYYSSEKRIARKKIQSK